MLCVEFTSNLLCGQHTLLKTLTVRLTSIHHTHTLSRFRRLIERVSQFSKLLKYFNSQCILMLLTDRTNGRAYATVLRLSVACRLSVCL